jgi:thioredoxin 1
MANEHVLVLGDENFQGEVLNSTVPVLVDFWAPWCAPCRMIAPAVEELAKKYAGQVKVGKLNIDEHQAVPMQYNVMSIPTILVFKDGKPVDQIVGAVPKQHLESMLKKAMNVA